MPYIGPPAPNRFVAPKAATQFSGDGSTTAFTLDHAVGSDEDILVSVDGVIQEPSVAYAVSNGTTLTFTAAPSSNSGNNIFVYYLFRTVSTVSHPSNNALSASTGTFTGDLTVDTTTLVVDSTNNRVGVGNDSPLSVIDVKGNNDNFSGMAKLNLTDTSSNSASRNWAVGNGGSAYGNFTISKSKTQGGNPSASGTHDNTLLIDNTGAVTMPLQPAFLVSGTAQNNIANGTTLQFGTEVFDQNSDFASNAFTAPVTGRYQLSFSIRFVELDSAASYYIIRLETSNRNYNPIFSGNIFSSDVTYYSYQFSILADMDANDTASVVYVQSGGTTQVDNDPSNAYFSGYLVC